ncbi:hypothetical protein [Coxiella endosymbiont of Amblyomma nuttalli]|uniref:hypothetical protein n=1 Tax=Coxiella endosymbiont of Amblyomma nuttalli TaxID=2749996 RepID=UPI001FD37C3B|nr:hypothetical protein [Coxiella endosymbiont of Amblyomma nuttalli]
MIEVNKEHNAVQKRYYGLGADIICLEQRIKDIQEQTQQWKIELEENKNLWEESKNNTFDCDTQLTELEIEIQRLKSRKSDIQSATDEAENALVQSEVNVARWQEIWEAFQAEAFTLMNQAEVIRTKHEHYEHQLVDLKNHREQLQKNLNQLQSEQLRTEIKSLTVCSESLNRTLSEVQSKLQSFTNDITKQRRTNQITRAELEALRRDLQTMEARATSMETLQKAALKNDDNQISK